MRSEVVALQKLGRLPRELDVSPTDLDARRRLVGALAPPVSEEEARVLISLFGDDQGDDLFGIAWSLVNLIESASGWPYWDVFEGSTNPWVATLSEAAERRMTSAQVVEEGREDQLVAERINAACGYGIESVYDLVNTTAAYPCAIPLLKELLPAIDARNIREGIVRALRTKDARGHLGDTLFAELDRTTEDYYRWVIAHVFAYVAGPKDGRRLASWLRSETYLSSRIDLATAIGLTGPAADTDVLVGLLDDPSPVAVKAAVRSLLKIGRPVDRGAMRKLRRLAKSEDGVTARAASRAVERLGPVTPDRRAN